MKINELRLGNYISVDCIMYKEVLKVTEVCPDGVFANTKYPNIPDIVFVKKEDIEPIELTEKVLLKIGFEKVHKKNIVGFNNVNEFILKNDINDNEFVNISYHLFESGNSIINIEQGDYYSGIDDNYIYKLNIKYLHELQNIYYCLTNQELEIEL